ncbi:MAG: Fur family transcriptional regulator [bacterium]
MRDKGLRITQQRDAILDYLLSTGEHPSARRVLENVRKKVPHISLSTVYGTLAELTKHNIIHELQFADAENRYEANLSQHINLVCVRCGKIVDYQTAFTVDLEQIRQATQFHAIQPHFELYGMCATCAKGR